MTTNLTALELLNLGDGDRTRPWINQHWSKVLGLLFGVSTGVIINFGTRRPLFSGIQKHVLGVAGWTIALTTLQNIRNDYLAEKDAVLRHYAELHHEDFCPAPRKKYADVLEPWIPIR
ncbi:NADH dehydrogenase [ubiquinone] 1 subunit C2 [Pectinophora gossypiella]|uniref:NADH dehydrogenase [ubiquinone] 1 subunit C2 n=1 Tax=Pectinophora gossypiella TaxID=13191 RepID=UPI00214EA869|nr:NADH dehydrogenase [ubiquinone] 1 subunit C2 [Pectinophora gossypiella]